MSKESAVMAAITVIFLPGVVSFFFAKWLYSSIQAMYFFRKWRFALFWFGTAIFVGMLGGALVRTLGGGHWTTAALVIGISWIIGAALLLLRPTPAMMKTWRAYNESRR